jgi:hypothetical protein
MSLQGVPAFNRQRTAKTHFNAESLIGPFHNLLVDISGSGQDSKPDPELNYYARNYFFGASFGASFFGGATKATGTFASVLYSLSVIVITTIPGVIKLK